MPDKGVVAHALRKKRASEERSNKTLSKVQVLYFEDGGPKRCNRCRWFLSDTSGCAILGRESSVSGPNGVCLLYTHGDPETSEKLPPQKLYTKLEVGYGEHPGGFSCGNCEYGGSSPRCLHPLLAGWDIDSRGGCCNAWEEN